MYICSSPMIVDRPKSVRRGSPWSESKIFSCEVWVISVGGDVRDETMYGFKIPVNYRRATRVQVLEPFRDAKKLGGQYLEADIRPGTRTDNCSTHNLYFLDS